MITPVSFPIAKLLKEKGFDKKVNIKYAFCDGGDIDEFKLVSSNDYEDFNLEYPERRKFINKNEVDELEEFSAPNISEVCMWLYEKHGIWISVDMIFEEHQTGFWYCIRESKDTDHAITSNEYSSPNEAYEAAIEYVLTNLL